VSTSTGPETDSGLIVSGARSSHVGGPDEHELRRHNGLPVKDKKFGLMFTVPMATSGLKLLCRNSYEMAAAVLGSPFDYPLSSRFDENDSIMVLDRVLVPVGERVHLRRGGGQRLHDPLRFPGAVHVTAARGWPSSWTSSPAARSRRSS